MDWNKCSDGNPPGRVVLVLYRPSGSDTDVWNPAIWGCPNGESPGWHLISHDRAEVTPLKHQPTHWIDVMREDLPPLNGWKTRTPRFVEWKITWTENGGLGFHFWDGHQFTNGKKGHEQVSVNLNVVMHWHNMPQPPEQSRNGKPR